MKLKLTAHKQFTAMLCHTMKQTSIMAVLAFICFIFFTSFYYDTYEPDIIHKTAHFFDDLRYNGIESLANYAFLGAGLVNAMLCFSFAWSKKQSNVVLSLGMKKSEIYFAKILGGILPMGLSIMLAGVIETLANVNGHYIVDKSFFAMAAFTMLRYLTVYVLAFALSSAVMANIGNVIEGSIFTLILAVFPTVFKGFLAHVFWLFTHGAYITSSENYIPEWNWSRPFEVFVNLQDNLMSNYFEPSITTLPSVTDWSGTIMASIYAVAIILLGYVGFRKRRNEICGTWGRAKGMNEITAAVAGFYSLYFIGLYMFTTSHGQANMMTYITCCGSFLIVYVVFRLVFGYKRKKEFKASLNRFPVYAMGLAVLFMVFGLGLFGYSSKIPEASEIKSVRVSSPYYKLYDDYLSGSSEFAFKLTRMANIPHPDLDGKMYYNLSNQPSVAFTDYSDIEKVVKIHESFVRDGKIKNNGEHSCASDVVITYTLKNGKTISRYYTESTEGTTLKFLTLNDSAAFNKFLFDYLNNSLNFNYLQSLVTEKDEEGYFDIDGYVEEYGESFPDDSLKYDIYYNYSNTQFLAQMPCYIFPTDMSAGYKLGFIDREFYDAIITDIKNMSANQYFNHSAEDELGVLSFGLSDSNYIEWNIEGKMIVADKYMPEEVTPPDGSINSTSWNVNSYDVKGIVVTKDMKNTVEYMKEHDLLKHFERKLDVQDIKYVKLATIGELIDGNYEKSEIFPIFYGAFWTGEQMTEWVRENSINHYYYRLFDHIHNEITDRKQIEKLLGEGVVFGYCASDSKIMEITYNDGSVATVMVRADALQ